MLQFRIMSMDNDTFITFDEILFTSKAKTHHSRIKNSLKYFQRDLKFYASAEEQVFQQYFDTYFEFITKHLEVTKHKDSAYLHNDVREAASAIAELEALESRLRELCAKDWSKPCNLTDPRECSCSEGSYSNEYILEGYAFIVQVLKNFNPLLAMRGPVVATSLVTQELTQTYWNRNVGLIYRMTPNNLIALSTSDLTSNVVLVNQDSGGISTIFDWSWFQQCYHVDVREGEGSAYYPFDVFVDLCKKRYKDPDIKELDRYNEVLLHPDFMNDVIGVFYQYNSPACEVDRARSFAEMSHIPVVRFNQDNSVTVFRKVQQ